MTDAGPPWADLLFGIDPLAHVRIAALEGEVGRLREALAAAEALAAELESDRALRDEDDYWSDGP